MAYSVLITNNNDTNTATPGDVELSSLSADLGTAALASGAGGTVTQQTNKSTGVTLNTATGSITMNNANLAAGTAVSFTLTNSLILATDLLGVEHVSGGTAGSYTVTAFPGAGSAVITIRNNTAGGLAEAIVLRYRIRRSADA